MKHFSISATGSTGQSSGKKRKTTGAQKRVDLYQEVTNRIIALLEQGTVPWKCPWSQYGLAQNYVTKHVYTGINMLLMNNTKHPVPYFMTFRQAKELGGKIRKGAKAERVYFYSRSYKNENGKRLTEQEAQTYKAAGKTLQVMSFLKRYNVFAINDVEGISFDVPEIKRYENERINRCEQIVANMPDKLVIDETSAENAYYSPSSDIITVPDISRFNNPTYFYVTLFHELIHATGHQSRLNRPAIVDSNKFGSAAYSEEELIAEIGASFLCAIAKIDCESTERNSAAYLDSWLKVLRSDKRLIFKAAAASQKAVNYILG